MLSGRRLFFGDSDYQTVKMVQEAKIPPLSSINKDVPPDLDRVLARALAQDPAKRYATAREFGTDLTAFLYKLGRPVSAYDIAEMVHGAMTLRRRPPPGDKASLIDKLIEEALLEFTSLQDGNKAAPAVGITPPGPAASEDIGGGADDANVSAVRPELARACAQLRCRKRLRRGTAALEDDERLLRQRVASPSSAPPPGQASWRPPPRRRARSRPRPEHADGLASAAAAIRCPDRRRAGDRRVYAWFGGLIPQRIRARHWLFQLRGRSSTTNRPPAPKGARSILSGSEIGLLGAAWASGLRRFWSSSRGRLGFLVGSRPRPCLLSACLELRALLDLLEGLFALAPRASSSRGTTSWMAF
jgi:hypothetical protein